MLRAVSLVCFCYETEWLRWIQLGYAPFQTVFMSLAYQLEFLLWWHCADSQAPSEYCGPLLLILYMACCAQMWFMLYNHCSSKREATQSVLLLPRLAIAWGAIASLAVGSVTAFSLSFFFRQHATHTLLKTLLCLLCPAISIYLMIHMWRQCKQLTVWLSKPWMLYITTESMAQYYVASSYCHSLWSL